MKYNVTHKTLTCDVYVSHPPAAELRLEKTGVWSPALSEQPELQTGRHQQDVQIDSIDTCKLYNCPWS